MDVRVVAVLILFYGACPAWKEFAVYINFLFVIGPCLQVTQWEFCCIACHITAVWTRKTPRCCLKDVAWKASIEALKEALLTNKVNLDVPENRSVENPSKLLTVVIVHDNEESEKISPKKYREPMLPLIENLNSEDFDEDTSGETNSDEYPNSGEYPASDKYPHSDAELDSDSESSYYHEDDYLKDQIMKKIELRNSENNELNFLRNRWKKCQKTQAKACTKACKVSYKNACQRQKCKKKLKRAFKKECKLNCKDLFVE